MVDSEVGYRQGFWVGTRLGMLDRVGPFDETIVGKLDGSVMGESLGNCVDRKEGLFVGFVVGETDGVIVGAFVGTTEGATGPVGLIDFISEGVVDGSIEGLLLGSRDGVVLGRYVGDDDGGTEYALKSVGLVDGKFDEPIDGIIDGNMLEGAVDVVGRNDIISVGTCDISSLGTNDGEAEGMLED